MYVCIYYRHVFVSNTFPLYARDLGSNQKSNEKLQVTQNSMLRSILVIRTKDKKISLDRIYSKTNTRRVWGTAKVLKMRYASHTAREHKQTMEPYSHHMGAT